MVTNLEPAIFANLNSLSVPESNALPLGHQATVYFIGNSKKALFASLLQLEKVGHWRTLHTWDWLGRVV
jgi:hypothetical protein